MWPLTILTQGAFQVKSQRIELLGKSLLCRVPGGEGDFLVSLLFSLGFSRYDPVVGPGDLEPGKGFSKGSPSVFLRDS